MVQSQENRKVYKVLYFILKYMKSITIYPGHKLVAELKNKAREEDRSLNNYILTILKKHIKWKREKKE